MQILSLCALAIDFFRIGALLFSATHAAVTTVRYLPSSSSGLGIILAKVRRTRRYAMAMSLGLLAGIIAGAVGLTSLVIALTILGLRRKHRRLLSGINMAGGRGLSDFATDPSAIMSITDEDVARMPGTRSSVQRSVHTPYKHNNLYTPMASRESLPRRAHIPKTRAEDRDDHEPVAPQQSWPLPRRMTRADGTPLVKMPSSTLTPVAKRSKNTLPSPPPKDTRNAPGPPRKDVTTLNGSLDFRKEGNITKASSATDLTPKPLFHGQQRSSSHGMIAELEEGSKTEPRVSRRTSQFPRSKSMYSQEPGLAPLQPLPPLPFENTPKRLPRVKSPEQSTRRASGGSLFSEQTSILEDNWSKAFSQAGADSRPITLALPAIPASAPQGFGQYGGNHIVWDSSHEEGRASPVEAAKQMAFRPQLSTQRSFRASIQESLPRSKSSGLSLSMSLHGPSRAESRASLGKDPSSSHSKSRVAIPRSAEKRKPRRGISPSSPLCRAIDFTIHDDTYSKRASTSILHAVSGNEGSPSPSTWDKRPRSIATSNPPEWDIESLPAAKPSAAKNRTSGHQRQNCIRISNIPVIVPSPAKPPAIKEQEEMPQENPQPHNQNRETRPKQTNFRPPSRQDFDFALQTTLGLHRENSRITDSHSPFSPTQFMMNLYREDNSLDSEVETPTRKPTSRRVSSGTHPNRRKTIFDNPIPTVWPLPTSSPEKHPDPEKSNNNNARLSTQSNDQDSNPDSRPPSFLLDFPWPQPPKPTAGSNWRGPKTPIRRIGGPRAPPFRYISPNRRRSPIRSGVGKRSVSPGKDLRRSVAALRRMNSEVVSSGGRKSREHKRYLSIGESESSAIFEDDPSSRPESRILFAQAQNAGADEDRLRADSKENLAGPTRDMRIFGGMTKLGPPSKGTNRVVRSPTGSMYDGDGFLKELNAWLR